MKISKTMGGRVFSHYKSSGRKDIAAKWAEQLRATGASVRIIKSKTSFTKSTRYSVYFSRKR